MQRQFASLITGFVLVVSVVACGGSTSNTAEKTTTAGTAAAADAATVTAFAGGRQSSAAPGAASPSGTTTGTTSSTGRGFGFATLIPAGSGAPTATRTSGATSAAGTPRGTIIGVGPGGQAASGTRAAGSTGTSGTTGPRATPRAGTPPGVVGNTYTDPIGRFTFTIAPGWTIQASNNPTVEVEAAGSSPRGAFRVVSEDAAGITLDEYTTAAMDSVQQNITGYQPVPSATQSLTIGGEPARRFDFLGRDSGVTIHGAVYVVKKGDTAYGIFIAAVPQDFDAVIDQTRVFVESFTFR